MFKVLTLTPFTICIHLNGSQASTLLAGRSYEAETSVILLRLSRVSQRGGGALGFPPLQQKFPPPHQTFGKNNHKLSPAYVPLYTLWFQQYDASCQKPPQNASKNAYIHVFLKLFLGRIPPLFPPPNINSSMKAFMV